MAKSEKTGVMPDVKFTKSGYEIRSDILNMARDYLMTEFNYKWQGWEVTSQRDPQSGQIVNKVDMPKYPNLEQILSTAEQMYNFVNRQHTN